jgi:hypothetical protein
MRSRVYHTVSCFLDGDSEGPIPAMYLLMRPLNHFVSAEEGNVRFTAVDFSGDNIIVAGQVLYLRNIRYFVETLIAEIKQHLKAQLFFGLDIVDMNWSPGIVYEEPRNTSIHHSCFHDHHNSFSRHKDDLLKVVLTHPSVHGRFHYLDQDRQIHWRAGPCFMYMDFCHEVEMLLFSGTQTSVGEPGRGTEVASHLVCNVSGGSIRNVFVMFQFFCMMGTFNKTSHTGERDLTMMRVPHPEIGRLWMMYLTFVRPLLVVWQGYFRGPAAAARARNRLFFGPHRPTTSGELSRYLSLHTHRILNVKISVALWRHIVTWFLNYHSVTVPDHLAVSNRSTLAAQLGHSESTHSLYAADARLPSRIDFHVVFQTMRASGTWHDLVGFRSTLLSDMNCRHRKIPADRVQGEESVGRSASTSLRDYLPVINDIAEQVRKALIPDIVHLNSQTRANDLASLMDAVGIGLQSPISQPLGQSPTHILHPSRLRDLRTFLKDENASFKTTQQALAVELIASKNPSVLLIGPTGSSFFLSVKTFS